jgi:NADPH-dependent 2,4-dienoyl-CoA reductase/sulfur reductase-like enzyme
MRLSSTILSRIRDRCGDDFIIGLAVSVDDTSGVTLSVEELQEVVGWHDERRLMDYVTCGTGSYFTFYEIIPTSLYRQGLGVPYAAALKRVVRHALVQAESHIRTPLAAEEVLAEGSADLVSIVRGQIADPYLVAKARDDRADEVRPCISCNQLCWGRRSRDYWISCLVNPSAGREFEWGGEPFAPATAPKHVLVVGGGPAGLETARVAATRGHRVMLVERGARLGGQFRLAGLQPSREQIGDLLAWLERELARLGVEVRLDTELDTAGVRAIGADVVVVATGARPSRAGFQRAAPAVDRLLGVDGEGVFAIHDVLDGTATPGPRVIVLDDLADWRGTGTALHLAESGHEVTIVTSAPVIAGGLAHSAADGPLRRRFLAAGGTALTNTVVDGWGDGRALIRFLLDGTSFQFEADTLVIAETAVSETALPDALAEAGIAYQAIGDVVAPRRASLAFYEARELARRL